MSADPNPNGAASPDHGIGTRQPSRPREVWFERSQIGSCRTSSGRSSTSSRPSSSPWYMYAPPGSASSSSTAARARLRPSSMSVCAFGHLADPGVRRHVHPVGREAGAGDRAPVAGGHADGVVVGEHPRGGRSDRAGRAEGQVDHVALRLGGPLAHQRVEVEGGVQLVGSHVLREFGGRCHPCLRHEDPGAQLGVGVGVGDGAPAAEDVVHVRLVHVRRAGEGGGQRRAVGVDVEVGQTRSPWPSSWRRRSGTRRCRGRTRTAGSSRTRRRPPGSPSSSRAARERTGGGTTGPACRRRRSCAPRRGRRTSPASCSAVRRRRGPTPSRKMNRSRSGDPGAAASAARNHSCWSLQWFGTRSISTRRPRSWAAATNRSASASVPKSGWMSR